MCLLLLNFNEHPNKLIQFLFQELRKIRCKGMGGQQKSSYGKAPPVSQSLKDPVNDYAVWRQGAGVGGGQVEMNSKDHHKDKSSKQCFSLYWSGRVLGGIRMACSHPSSSPAHREGKEGWGSVLSLIL